jgi:hypothetical protein
VQVAVLSRLLLTTTHSILERIMDTHERTVKRSFPRVPELSEVDPSNTVAVYEARDQRVRDQFVALEELRMVREKLTACYEREGTDHHTKCKKLAAAFVARMRFPNYVPPPVSSISPLTATLSFSLFLGSFLKLGFKQAIKCCVFLCRAMWTTSEEVFHIETKGI